MADDGKNWWRYFLFRFGAGIARTLPVGWSYALAAAISRYNHRCDRAGREKVRANLAAARPDLADAELDSATREVFRHFGMYLVEFPRMSVVGDAYYKERVEFAGLENLDAALALGRGALVVSGHMSNWELAAAALAQRGYPVTVSVAMHREPRVNDIYLRQRRDMGLEVLDAAHPGTGKALLRALADNRVVGLLGDRDPTGGGLAVEFFGRSCRFPQGPARLALARDTPLLPTFCRRFPGPNFRVSIQKPLPTPDPALDKKERTQRLTRSFAAELETAIREAPVQWTIFYRPWDDEWVPQ